MPPTTKNQVGLIENLVIDRQERLCQRLQIQLGCLGTERDPQGSNFWYLRLGTDELEIPNTRPIAIGFDDRLNDLTETEIKDFLTAKDSEIYRHYLDRVSVEQPVMYLLYPISEESGRVAFILPQEGGLKQRDIKIFELGSRELATRLERFKIVPIAQNILYSVPLVERVFYDPIETSKDLAQQLAKVAKSIEQIIPQVYRDEKSEKDGYAIAHLKLSLFLQESGYEFDPNQRLKVYLTNTLDNAPRKSEFLFDEFIASEANEATSIKQDEPVMVVVGNPPYSGHSENKGEWISNLLKDYYQVDGKPLGEKNSKWLQDDYVKFIRFSQWRIQQTGMGILAFITNHGYLDNPTFRGMRRSLDKTFDEMYIFDLHGNSKKKEVAPDGSKDENVFDIQQGVAIGLMVKLP